LRVLRAAGIRPVSPVRLPLHFLPPLLRLPDFPFRLAAQPMLRIDPEARSSTWEDLTRGRPAETGQFQGAIVKLALRHGVKAPLLKTGLDLIDGAEAAGGGSPGLSPEDILLRLPV